MRKADNLPPSCAFVTKYGSLNFLEPPGPVHVCNGTALPLPFTYLPSYMASHFSNIICRNRSFLFISQCKKVDFKIHTKQQMYTDVRLCDILFCDRHVKPKIHFTSVTIIQSGPNKCIHYLLINIFGINLNETSISG